MRGPRPRDVRSPALRIRPHTPADRAAILELWNHFWDEDEMDCFDRTYRAVELPAFLACDGQRVVGVLSYATERAWRAANIVALHVLPGYQGRGGAGRLIAALEEEAGSLGLARLIVATSNDNPVALFMYQRLGFRVTGIQVGAIGPDRVGEPHLGVGGIPVRDEIRLEKWIEGQEAVEI